MTIRTNEVKIGQTLFLPRRLDPNHLQAEGAAKGGSFIICQLQSENEQNCDAFAIILKHTSANEKRYFLPQIV
jgi:hypothetical protein